MKATAANVVSGSAENAMKDRPEERREVRYEGAAR